MISQYSIHACATGKWCFTSRKEAKTLLRTLKQQGEGKACRAYECRDCGYWHVGHLPHMVRRGIVSQNEFYTRVKKD